ERRDRASSRRDDDGGVGLLRPLVCAPHAEPLPQATVQSGRAGSGSVDRWSPRSSSQACHGRPAAPDAGRLIGQHCMEHPGPSGIVHVVVVNYRTPEMTTDTLEHLLASDVPGYDVCIWLVDNGSADGSAATLRSRFPDINL